MMVPGYGIIAMTTVVGAVKKKRMRIFLVSSSNLTRRLVVLL